MVLTPASDFQERIQRSLFAKNVLCGILYSATQEGRKRLPTNEKIILSTLVKGVVEYLAGEIPQELYEHITPTAFDEMTRVWPPREERIEFFYHWNLGTAELNGKTLQLRIKGALDELVHYSWKPYSPPDKGGYHWNELYRIFKGGGFGPGICTNHFEETFSLESTLCFEVKDFIFPELSAAERREVEGIGNRMGKWIGKDCEYWEENSSFRSP